MHANLINFHCVGIKMSTIIIANNCINNEFKHDCWSSFTQQSKTEKTKTGALLPVNSCKHNSRNFQDFCPKRLQQMATFHWQQISYEM